MLSRRKVPYNTRFVHSKTIHALTTHGMLQSCTYVWKNEKFRDEEDSSVADEKCTRGSAEDDYGDA